MTQTTKNEPLPARGETITIGHPVGSKEYKRVMASLHQIKNEPLRDTWEQRALTVFKRVYLAQQRRVTPAILEAERQEMLSLLNVLFQGEPEQVAEDITKFMTELTEDVVAVSLLEVGATTNPATLEAAINLLVEEGAKLFGDTMSANSQQLSYGTIQDWLDTPGSTVGELRQRMGRIWQGPRPNTAAVHETTKLVGETRITSWKESGLVEGYHVDTQGDANVRPEHTAVSNNGPYPLNDSTGYVPINGDIGCRCVVRPAVVL